MQHVLRRTVVVPRRKTESAQAVQRELAGRQSNGDRHRPKVRLAPKQGKKTIKIPRSRAIFNIVMIIVIACFSIALVRVVQYALYNQFAMENEGIKQKIAAQTQLKEELLSRKLSLESPQRIESIAKVKLKMVRPNNVRYLVFNEPKVESRVAYLGK